MSNRGELINIAATLVRGEFLPSENWEDWQEILPKSTPKSAIREITQQSADAAEACRLLAIRIRDVADSGSS